jgi:hypothetical protein
MSTLKEIIDRGICRFAENLTLQDAIALKFGEDISITPNFVPPNEMVRYVAKISMEFPRFTVNYIAKNTYNTYAEIRANSIGDITTIDTSATLPLGNNITLADILLYRILPFPFVKLEPGSAVKIVYTFRDKENLNKILYLVIVESDFNNVFGKRKLIAIDEKLIESVISLQEGVSEDCKFFVNGTDHEYGAEKFLAEYIKPYEEDYCKYFPPEILKKNKYYRDDEILEEFK